MGDEHLESGISPPEYTRGGSNKDSPPSYVSLYGQIKEIKRDSEGQGQYIKSVCDIIVNTVGFTILLIILLAIPVLMIVVGALNLQNCPVERFIPIWLIVSGCTAAFQQIVSLIKRLKQRKGNSNEGDEPVKQNNAFVCFDSLFGCFQVAWFIAGCVWVYRNFAPDTSNSLLDTYCDHTTYYLAFWLLTVAFIIMAFFFSCCCCILFCVAAASD